MKTNSTFLNFLVLLRKSFIVFVLCLFFPVNTVSAQCWQWASGLGGANMETPTSLAVDSYGHMAVTGEFMGTAVFGAHTLEATSGRDVFTVLVDSTGAVLNVMSGAGDGSENIGVGVAFDAIGNFIVTGNFTGSISFGDITLVSAGLGDVFLVKYNSVGDLVWARQAGGDSNILANDIAVDTDGNCFIIGNFYNTANFGENAVSSSSAEDVFIAKYDADGNAMWAVACGALGSDIGNAIAADDAGNVYIAGYFQSRFGFGGINYSSAGNRDVFVAKMDKDGTPLWAVTGGGSNNDFFNKIAVDAGGNDVYVTGEFESYTADIDGIILTNSNQSAPRKDIMLLNLDGLGSARWGISAGSEAHDYANDVTTDEIGDVYITGIFQDQIIFGNTTLTNDDLYIAKYDSTGNFLWATGSAYNSAQAASNSIATFKNRPVIAGDFIAGPAPPIAVFDSDTIISNGSIDVFLARVGPPCQVDVTGISNRITACVEVDVFPNPFSRELHIRSNERTGSLDISIYNAQGQLVLSNQLHNAGSFTVSTWHLPAGFYLVNVRSGNAVRSIKMAKVEN